MEEERRRNEFYPTDEEAAKMWQRMQLMQWQREFCMGQWVLENIAEEKSLPAEVVRHIMSYLRFRYYTCLFCPRWRRMDLLEKKRD